MVVLPKIEKIHYTLMDYILFFFSFAIIGWVWEVALHIVQSGEFVNRGVLLGPWLPIYGAGGVLVLFFLSRIQDRPVLTFFLTMLICSIVEYGTGWYLEVTKGIRWWDYSGYFLNINGRVCLEGAIVFGIGGCLILYVVAPKLKLFYNKIPQQVKICLCTVLVSVIALDFIRSSDHPNTGKGISDHIESAKKEDAPTGSLLSKIDYS